MKNPAPCRFMLVGVIGLAITLTLNLVGVRVLDQVAAEFFSPRWWQTWFPNYAVWSVTAVVGGRQFLAKR